MIKRIMQFWHALAARLSAEDRAFVSGYLHDKELGLFNAMNIYDRRHAVLTAYTAARMADHRTVNRRLLIKAALLHDIGRNAAAVCLADKVVFVLLEAISVKAAVRAARRGGRGTIGRRRNALYICMHHAALGAEKLEQIDEWAVAQLVKRHHDKPNAADSNELILLRMADALN